MKVKVKLPLCSSGHHTHSCPPAAQLRKHSGLLCDTIRDLCLSTKAWWRQSFVEESSMKKAKGSIGAHWVRTLVFFMKCGDWVWLCVTLISRYCTLIQSETCSETSHQESCSNVDRTMTNTMALQQLFFVLFCFVFPQWRYEDSLLENVVPFVNGNHFDQWQKTPRAWTSLCSLVLNLLVQVCKNCLEV